MSPSNRERLIVAYYLGGCAIATSYVGLVHPLSAGLSVVLGLHHCVANCIVMRAMQPYYPEAYEEFWTMVDKQGVEIPKGVARNLSEAAYEALFAATVIHEKPLTNARVVVCTYPQTTYTDAFLSGCPVILLYDPSISVLEEPAMDLISEMIHENMCFYDYATAASHIEQIWHNPLEWWNSDAVMRVHNLFAAYAKLDEKDKISVWGQFFSHI